MTLFFAMVPDNEGGRRPAFFLGKKMAPDGAVEISSARHETLLAAQAQGKPISADAKGSPRIETRTINAARRRDGLIGAVKREAARRIDQVSPTWRQLNDTRSPSPDGDRRFAQIDAIREASARIEADIVEASAAQLGEYPVSTNPLWPEFDQ